MTPRPHRAPGTATRALAIDERLDGATPPTIVIATDAAASSAAVGSGYIATSGHYGLAGHPHPRAVVGPSGVVVAELRAIHRALLKVVAGCPGVPVTVLTDSREAIRFITSWRNGQDAFPAGYVIVRTNGKTPTLVRLARAVRRPALDLTLRKVRAHTGHPLNECADSLAKAALRVVRGSLAAEVAVRNAESWARARLADYERDARSRGHQIAH